MYWMILTVYVDHHSDRPATDISHFSLLWFLRACQSFDWMWPCNNSIWLLSLGSDRSHICDGCQLLPSWGWDRQGKMLEETASTLRFATRMMKAQTQEGWISNVSNRSSVRGRRWIPMSRDHHQVASILKNIWNYIHNLVGRDALHAL